MNEKQAKQMIDLLLQISEQLESMENKLADIESNTSHSSLQINDMDSIAGKIDKVIYELRK